MVRAGVAARTLRLTEKGWEAAGRMALLGKIAAGRGLEAVAFGDEVTRRRRSCSRRVPGGGATCCGLWDRAW